MVLIWANREDAPNVNGGLFCIRVSKEESAEAWTNLILAVIGEQFSDFMG